MYTVIDREYSLVACTWYQEEKGTAYPQGHLKAAYGNKITSQRMGAECGGTKGWSIYCFSQEGMINLAEWFCRLFRVVPWARRVVCLGHLLQCNRVEDLQWRYLSPSPCFPRYQRRLLSLSMFSSCNHTVTCISNVILFKTIISYYYVYMHGGRNTHVPRIHIDNTMESGLTFHVSTGSRDPTHEARLGQWSLCPRSHLAHVLFIAM